MRRQLDVAGVLRAAQVANPAAVLDHLMMAARDFGATDVVAYLVDFEQLVLEPLPDRATHSELPTTEAVASTVAGRAFLTRSPVAVERVDGTRVWVPIVEGSDRTGVLAFTLQHVDDDVLEAAADLGILAGYLIAAHTRCTDIYQLHRRRKAMSLAASMQWDLLPPLVLRAPSCSVAGRLEPAYEVGGDSFDYALNGPVLDVAIVDAMGHGVGASTIASVAIGCYRHGRRESRTLESLHAALDTAVSRQFDGVAFVTGQLAQLDVRSGVLTWTNAGHPRPLLLRGSRVLGQLECEPTLPWGLGGQLPEVGRDPLEPGDRVLFFTDGVTDARTPEGDEFGIERLSDVVTQTASDELSPEEIVRHVVRSVTEHRAAELIDDATVVLIEWTGSEH